MKKRVLALVALFALFALSASSAFAAVGVNLRWSSCLTDAGAINRSFACASNSGSQTLVGSFELGADMFQVSGLEVVVDLASGGTSLPAWWQFKNVGTCRQTALSANFSFPVSSVNCADWAQGQSAGGIGSYNVGGPLGANTARLLMAIAVAPVALQDLIPATEYFAYNLVISNAKTVGTGSCAGCNVPVCLNVNSIKVTTPVAANDIRIAGPTNGTDSNYATWQGGAGITTNLGSGCPRAVPTRNTTWSSVKSLYR